MRCKTRLGGGLGDIVLTCKTCSAFKGRGTRGRCHPKRGGSRGASTTTSDPRLLPRSSLDEAAPPAACADVPVHKSVPSTRGTEHSPRVHE